MSTLINAISVSEVLFLINSGTLGNVDTIKAQSASNTAHMVTSSGWIGLHWTLCPETDTARSSVIESSGRKDSARLGARHTNTCFQDGDRMADSMDPGPSRSEKQ